MIGATNFLTMVIVGRVCGMEELGVFALAWTVLLAINVMQEALVSSPFTVSLGQFTEKTARKTYIWTALALQMSLAAATAAATLITALSLERIGAHSTVQAVTWSLLIAIPAVSLREFARRYLFAKLDAAKVLVLDTIVAALQVTGLCALWYNGALSPGTALALLACSAGLPAVIWLIANRSAFKIASSSELISQWRRHWRLGRWIGASQLSDLAVTHGVTWLVAAFAGTAAAGIFAACNSLIMVVNPLILGLGNVLLPRTAEANHTHGSSEVSRIVWKATSVLALVVGLLCFVLAVFGEGLVGTFYALSSLDGVRDVIILLAIANFIGATSFAVDNGLLVVNRPDVNFAASIVGLAFTFVLSAVFTPYLGVIGTALGVLIGTLLNSLYQIVAFVRLVGRPALSLGEPETSDT